ncbi:MAG: beta-lactamase family protein [Gemmatimonadetes bacterium]|nr:beta-lactamase family protein [Gemmatimonadota bacterium]
MTDWTSLLTDALEKHGLPGASIAIWRDGRVEVAAAGLANVRTGEPATAEHLFSYGSVTKVITATAVARQITLGKLNLDTPVMDYLPEFAPPDDRARAITVRHLLCHTSGLVGTLFKDTGKNADAIAGQIQLLNEHRLYHRPGALISYCNSGMIMLGRLLDVTTGKPWPQALAEVLTGPLGLETVITTPEQALTWRHVIGHVPGPAGWLVEPVPFFIPGHSPAGSTPMGRVRDLLTIARVHLDGGTAPDGSPFLDPGLVTEMQRQQCRAAVDRQLCGYGLGWMIYEVAGRTILGHDGATLGSNAHFRIDPGSGFAVALAINASMGIPLYEEVMEVVFREALGVRMPGAPAPLAIDRADLAPWLGRYADVMLQQPLFVEDGRLLLETAPNPANTWLHFPPRTIELFVSGPGQFYAKGADALPYAPPRPVTLETWRPFAVFEADGDRYLQSSMLSFRKTA